MKRRERAHGGQTEGTCRADKREREKRRERESERGINDEEWQLRYLSASCDARPRVVIDSGNLYGQYAWHMQASAAACAAAIADIIAGI